MYKVDVKTKRYRTPKLHVSVYGKTRLISAETTARVYLVTGNDDGELVGAGHAYCAAKDNFRRSEAVKRAVERAVEKLPREVRTQVWAKVWKGER